ncbi:MAG: slipin family protein [Nitrospinota bacterium]|nr:slipin family protein [Nitrospinota bacterium]MDH5755770.1 slipin family protein [Nitrospinota bacterium]
MELVIIIAAVLLFTYLLVVTFPKLCVVTVNEYEAGIRFHRGVITEVAPPGMYIISGIFTEIVKIDTRPTYVKVPTQEVLSSDGVTLKLSVIACYQVTDARKMITSISNDHESAIYYMIQLSLREIVGEKKVEELLAGRQELADAALKAVGEKADQVGVKIHSLGIKDISFPGPMKQVFAETVKARQEAMALLEKARGETAALRSLANAANMVKDNPALLHLRTLQSTGNTLVFGVDPARLGPPAGESGADAAKP